MQRIPAIVLCICFFELFMEILEKKSQKLEMNYDFTLKQYVAENNLTGST